ncbi:hypothetical protein [Paraburkholderia sp. SUR17]|uniref:hypothetical protein n=1 Tax=Paraburkholderia sp. SUR17 TaxID=3034358 RepID=UPI0024087CAE|nr:hypothetical protein [Paraburkholderia sp. SUR17]WEY37989.1 hypothetical protein P2869_13085 [Paraburkholderia sp. SUR17]
MKFAMRPARQKGHDEMDTPKGREDGARRAGLPHGDVLADNRAMSTRLRAARA